MNTPPENKFTILLKFSVRFVGVDAHIDPAECTVFYGSPRRIRWFPMGRCGHRPLRKGGKISENPMRASRQISEKSDTISANFTDKERSVGALFSIQLNSFLTRYPINSTIDNWNSYSRPWGAGELLGGLTYSAPVIRKLPNTVKRRCARNLWNLIR